MPGENLDNILWRALSGSHAHLASGTASIRRYAKGFSPLIAYADPAAPDLASLAPYCDSGEQFYCAYWLGPVPNGWSVEVETSMCAMLWDGETPAEDAQLDAVRLGPPHVPQMLALAALTKPGPFAGRTLEMGEFYGVIENGTVIAMAGERMQAGKLHEVSAICTAPEHQGRGLGKRLTALMVRRQLARGERPFLHVASANAVARRLYERLGFRLEREVPLRVIRKASE